MSGAVGAPALTSHKNVIAVAWKRAGPCHHTGDRRQHGARCSRPFRRKASPSLRSVQMAISWQPAAPTRQPRLWQLNGTLVHVLPQRGHILGLSSSRGTGRRSRQHEPGRNRRCLDGRHRRARAAADRRDRCSERRGDRARPKRVCGGLRGSRRGASTTARTDGCSLRSPAMAAALPRSRSMRPAKRSRRAATTERSGCGTPIRAIGSPRREARDPARTGSRASPPRTAASSPRAKAGNAYLRDAKTGRLVHVLSGHRCLVTDGRVLRATAVCSSPPAWITTRASGTWTRAVGARAARALLPGQCRLHSGRTGSGSSPPANSPPGSGTRETGQLVEYLRGAVRPLSNAAFATTAPSSPGITSGNGWESDLRRL